MMLIHPRRTVVVQFEGIPLMAVGAVLGSCGAVMERGRVVAMTREAEARGVMIDMRSTEAVARCPTLECWERDGYQEKRWLERLETHFERISPHFRPYRHSLAAPIRSMVRYFGTEEQVFAQIEAVSVALAVDYPQIGITIGGADSLFAASVAAPLAKRIPPGQSGTFLGALRVQELLPPSMVKVLREVGIEQVADFQGLDAVLIAARFGGEGLRWHRLCCLQADIAVPDTQPTHILMCATSVFDDDTIERICFRLMRPLGELLHSAEERGMVLVGARIVLVTAAQEHDKVVEILDGISAAELIVRLRWFAEAIQPRHAPFVEVRIEPLRWSPYRRRQLTFDRNELKESAVLATLTRLATRYGDDRVLVPALGGGRSLGEEGTWVFWSGTWPTPVCTDSQSLPWPGRLPGAAPSLVYRHFREIEISDVAGHEVEVSGDGLVTSEPAYLLLGHRRLAILSFFGPWVVVERWWERRRRRYARLMVVTSGGVKLVVRESHRWWLEGEFA